MRSRALRWLLFALLVTGIALAILYRDHLDAATLQQWIEQAGTAAPLLFMLIYAIGTVFFLPGSVMTLAGGALFGPVLGTLYNLTGATIGAVLAFLIARFFTSNWVEQKTGGRLKQLKEGVENEGWRFVAFVRLVPLFPFNLLNYALGLTRIRLVHYLIATYLCMLPGALAYTYLGYAGREAVAGGEGLIQKAMLALALLAVVAFLPRIISRFRQGPTLNIGELNERLNKNDELLLLDVRSANDYQGELGHIAGSRNIPLEALESRLPELSPDLKTTIALVCTTDRRSKKAARILGNRGFANVQVVLGGMTQWNQEGRRVNQVEPQLVDE
ncbi:MAG: VTT domain-containing protein [gamma proteobacterium endosymbiont of Lamellibrachia anaximandri]|nr:VTT domain-containing protein [gamma proteobacterium endosymbiont of Lamellibrachia anaximandri]MBL3534354.1 VTT domain-containing protein [gamma proteobacterium endosymbiont of Lamellibrachia anaximandri]